ncbi:hypothetical protein KGM_209216A, partial [Danaus plexippus plexippus]
MVSTKCRDVLGVLDECEAMSIQKCLLDNSSRMIKAMSTAKSSNNEVKT